MAEVSTTDFNRLGVGFPLRRTFQVNLQNSVTPLQSGVYNHGTTAGVTARTPLDLTPDAY